MKKSLTLFLALALLTMPIPALADNTPLPSLTISLGQAESNEEVASTLTLVILLTILSLAPSILILATAFTRIIIVLSLLRNAIGLQQIPPNQVLIGLALFLTFFVMAPVFVEVNADAIQPYLNEEIGFEQAIKTSLNPIREYMRSQTRKSDLDLFLQLHGQSEVADAKQIPDYVLMPAYLISELKTAFQMGFILFVPFLVIDMVVASILMSMGMMMLPPVMISLPFKVLLFVMVDGWSIITRSLILSFR